MTVCNASNWSGRDEGPEMKIAKSRNWTETEVQAAISVIRAEPGLWNELEHIEKTTADFRDTDVGLRERVLIKKLHPTSTFHEITQLYFEVRKFRRAALGLK
jgi:hypothetical protein